MIDGMPRIERDLIEEIKRRGGERERCLTTRGL